MDVKTAIVVDKSGICVLLNDQSKAVVRVIDDGDSLIALDYKLQKEEQLVFDDLPHALIQLKPRFNSSAKKWEETATPEEIEAARPPAVDPPPDESLMVQLAVAEVYEKQLQQDEEMLITQLAVAEIYELLG